MAKKCLFVIAILAMFTAVCFGQVASNRKYYSISVVDEFGELRTDLSSITVQNESGVAVAVYSTQMGSTEVGSTGVISSGISDGEIEFWYEDTAIDLTCATSTYNYEIESFANTTHRFMLPSFITSVSSTSYGQTNDIDFTYASWIIDGDTANRLDMIPDNDGGILGIGDGTAQADIYMYTSSTDYIFFDEGNGILNMVDINVELDDDAILKFGSGDDFSVYSDTADQLEFDPANAGAAILFGTAAADAVDITWYGDTSGDTVAFDEENCEVLFTDIDLQLDDAANLILGTNDDFVIECDQAGILEIIAASQGGSIYTSDDNTHSVNLVWYSDTSGDTVTFDEENVDVDFVDVDLDLDDSAYLRFGTSDDVTVTYDGTGNDLDITFDDLEIAFGVDGGGGDVYWHTETTGDNVFFDEDNAEILFTDVDIQLDDDADLIIGTNDDFVIESDTAGVLEILPAAAGNNVNFGVTAGTSSVDIYWFSDTSGDNVFFDEENVQVQFEDVQLQMMDDTKIALGDADDFTLEYDEDGYDVALYHGGLIPDSADVETHTANDTLDNAADVGGWHLVNTDAVVLTLPAVATGLTYRVMNVGAAAAVEIHVDTNAADRILGGCGFTALDDGDKITNTKASAEPGDYVVIGYGTADGWYIIDMCGTWADGGA